MVIENHLHYTRGDKEMKKTIGIVKNLMICAIIAVFMVGCFLGAVLQTSYRLCPVTSEEIAEVAK